MDKVCVQNTLVKAHQLRVRIDDVLQGGRHLLDLRNVCKQSGIEGGGAITVNKVGLLLGGESTV